jgi:Flp pilus assembly protein protease CpaA
LTSALTVAALFGWSVAIAWIDWRTRRIPNSLLLLALVPCLVMLAVSAKGPLGADPTHSLLGAIEATVLFLPGFLMKLNGGGDVKLAACCGALLGAPLALAMMLIASLLLGAASVWIMMRRRRGHAVQARFAAGPAIVCGFVVAMLFARMGTS